MNKSHLLASAALLSILSLTTPAQAEPQGGQVRSGGATIQQTLGTTTVNQHTQKAIVDWRKFNVGPNELVKFVQPGRSALILNRVTGQDPSKIEGRIQANGQVFLVNPNGILFTPNAQVDVGSLMATTLGLSNQDFLSGNYRFEQQGELTSVVNQGTITVSDEGYVVLAAPLVSNEGLIVANLGRVELQAGSKGTLNLDGQNLVSYQLDASQQTGTVLLTREAVSDLLRSALGATEMREEGGQIRLVGAEGTLAQSGTVQAPGGTVVAQSTRRSDIAGTLSAGFVETSSHHQLDFHGTVLAGDWLIDPANLTVVTTPSGPNEIAASSIETTLNGGGNVTLNAQTQLGSERGDIVVNAPIHKTAGTNATLTLHAGDSAGIIQVNQAIDSTSGQLNLALQAGDSVTVSANVDNNGGTFTSTGNGAFTQTGTLAAGNIAMTHGSDLTVASATATGVIALEAGTILDGDSGTDDLDLGAPTVSLTASGIGDIEVNAPTQLEIVALAGTNQVTLTAPTNDLSAYSQGGDLLVTGGSSLSYERVSGNLTASNPGKAISLNTNGAITDGNGLAVNVTAKDISLVASSRVGTGNDPFQIAAGGTVHIDGTRFNVINNATATIDASFHAVTGDLQYEQRGAQLLRIDDSNLVGAASATFINNGDISVPNLTATGALVGIQAIGNIQGGNVQAASLDLSATGGIGTSSRLQVNLTDSLTTSATGVTDIDLGASDLQTLEVHGANAQLHVTGTGGDKVDWNQVTGALSASNLGGVLTVTVGGDLTSSTGIDAQAADLTLVANGVINLSVAATNSLRVENLQASGAVILNAGSALPNTTELKVDHGDVTVNTTGDDFVSYVASNGRLSGSKLGTLRFTTTGDVNGFVGQSLFAETLEVEAANVGDASPLQVVGPDVTLRATDPSAVIDVILLSVPDRLALVLPDGDIQVTQNSNFVEYTQSSHQLAGVFLDSALELQTQVPILVDQIVADRVTLSTTSTIDELGSDGAADIVSPNITLSADGGIGMTGVPELSGDQLDLTVGASSQVNLSDAFSDFTVNTNNQAVTITGSPQTLSFNPVTGLTADVGASNLKFVNQGTLATQDVRGGQIWLVASGPILQGGNDPQPDIIATGVVLQSDQGIGTALKPVQVTATGSLYAETQDGDIFLSSQSASTTFASLVAVQGDIHLSQTGGGNLQVNLAEAQLGAVELTSDAGMTAGGILARDTLTTRAMTTSIGVATYRDLDVTSLGGNAQHGAILNYQAATGVLTIDSPTSIAFRLTGDITGGMVEANSITLQATSITGFAFDAFDFSAETDNTLSVVGQTTLGPRASLLSHTGSITYQQATNHDVLFAAEAPQGDITITHSGTGDLGVIYARAPLGGVGIEAQHGSITDQSPFDPDDVVGQSVLLSASSGVGTLDVKAIVRLTVTGQTGQIALGATPDQLEVNSTGGDFQVGSLLSYTGGALVVNHPGGIVAFSTTGGITDGNGGAVNATASELYLKSATGIGAVDALELNVASSLGLEANAGIEASNGSNNLSRLDVTAGSGTAQVTGSVDGLAYASGVLSFANVGGEVNFSTSGSITAVSGTSDTLGLIAVGSILTPDVTARNLTVVSGASIGVVNTSTGNTSVYLEGQGNVAFGQVGGTLTLEAISHAGRVDLSFSETGKTYTLTSIEAATVASVLSTGAGSDLVVASVTAPTVSLGSARDVSGTSVTATNLTLSGRNLSAGISGLTALTVQTSGNVALTGTDALAYDHSSGALTASNAGGSIDFTTSGEITGGNVTATGLTLSSTGRVLLDTQVATLALSAVGTVDVQDLSGGLVVTQATGGAMTLQALGGGLTVQNASATGALMLISDDALVVGNASATGTLTGLATTTITQLGSDTTADLTAPTIELTGSQGIALEVDATHLSAFVEFAGAIALTDTAGGVTVDLAQTAGGNIALTASGGDLTLTNVSAAGSLNAVATGDILVGSASGTSSATLMGNRINELGDDPGADLTAPSLTLTAVRGIGLGNNLDVLADSLTATVTGSGPVALSDLGGGLTVASATAADGLVRLLTKNGNLSVTLASAGGAAHNVTLSTFGFGDVVVDDILALDGTIAVTSAGNLRQADADLTADLYSKRVSAVTASGINGLELATETVTNATVAGVGGISLRDLSGGLVVSNATTSDGVMGFEADGGPLTVTSAIVGGAGRGFTALADGDILVGRVSASGDTIVLDAAGVVREAGSDPEADLVGTDLIVDSAGLGDAGATIETTLVRLNAAIVGTGRILLSETDNLQVQTASTVSGAINIRANGLLTLSNVVSGGTGIFETLTAGNVLVDDVRANSAVTVNAFGNINESGNDAAADMRGSAIALSAGTGVGTAASVEIESGGNLSVFVSGTGKIDLTDVSSSGALLTLDNIVASNGPVSITASRSLRASHVTGSAITLTTSGSGSIQVDEVFATGAVTLDSAQNVTEIGVDPQLDVTAGAASIIRATMGVIGTSDALELGITGGALSVYAGGQIGGASIKLGGSVTGGLIHLNTPPGTSTFNGVPF